MLKIITFLFLSVPLFIYAQNEFYNTGSDVYVQQGALLHVQGTLTNAVDAGGHTGVFTNDGIIELDGDFSSASNTTFQPDLTTTSTDRTVKFTGLGTENIKGTGIASFYNLVLDKQSATDVVMLQTNATVTGSIIFNTGSTYSGLYPSGVLSTTYNPSITTGVTNNGLGGLLQTFDGSGNEWLLDVQNTNTDAINGYPALIIDGNPVTGYVLTKGTSGSANGGLQRAIGSATSYLYPIGTSLHGFNAVKYNFTSVPSGAKTVKGKFCDYQTSASGISGSGCTGTIDDICINCGGNYVAPNNEGWNYYFASNPCNGSSPQWFMLEGLQVKHGYWTFTSNNNSAFTYSIEAFPNNVTTLTGFSPEIWRVLKYDDAGHTYGYDPSQQDWTSQITSQISVTSPLYTDLLTYSLNTGSCYAGSGVPGGLYIGFSEFSLQESNSGTALPVTLIDLEAYPVENTFIQVQWTTDLEINNQGFKVERSTDAINFTQIGWVAGHDNSTQQNTYYYNDYNVAPNVVYYYRLLQVDNNGNQTPTNIVQAQITGGNIFTIGDLVPNPAMDHSTLSITTSQPLSISVKLYDIIGQQLSENDYNLVSGANLVGFNTQPLASGTYTIIVQAGDKFYSRKLVVTK